MFKAQIIESEKYYRLRRLMFFIALPSIILYGFLSNFWTLKAYWIVVIITLVVISFIIQMKIHNKTIDLSKQRKIEIDEDEIRIQSSEGHLLNSFKFEDLDQFEIKGFTIATDERSSDLLSAVFGNPKKNILKFNHNGKQYKFEFLIESHYMVEQLKKIIDRNYNISTSILEQT